MFPFKKETADFETFRFFNITDYWKSQTNF